jgi:integrase
MKRNKICILPHLVDCHGDINKQWYVVFSYRNPKTNKMTRFRIYDGFTEKKTKREKYALGKQLIQAYTEKLKSGWDPLADDTQAIFDDQLQYAPIAKAFGNKRKSNKNFSYFTSQFLPEIKGLKKITYQNYISKYRTFNNYLIKNGADDNDITAISNEMIIGFFLFLINDLKLAHITVSKYEHMLAAIFNWLVEKKHIHKSPVYNIPKTTRENDTAPRPVNEMDIDKLVDEIKKDRQLWLAVQLEYYCFLRPGLEIRMSRVKWFDLARGRIIVPRDLIKSKVDKVVIIPAQLREHLLVDCKLHLFPPDYFVFGSNGMPGTQPIGNNNLRNRFNRVRDSLGLPLEYKLYSWKHTGNARAEDAGIPMAARQRQNGHRSMRSTEEYLKNKIGFHSEELEKEFPSL